MDFLYTPYKKLKGKKAREERNVKRTALVKKAGEAFANVGRKLGATNIIEKLEDTGQTLASKALNFAGYEGGGIVQEYKKGGKVKRKKVVKKQKQKQKQVVKQSVVVKVGGDVVKKRRAYKPREKQAQVQPTSISFMPSISYTPTMQDQSQYELLNQQIKELQKEKRQAIKEEQKPLAVEGEAKKIKEVREKQQREYIQKIEKPEKEFLKGLRAPLTTSVPPTEVPKYEAPVIKETETKKGRGRPKSSVPVEERRRQYAEKQRQKRMEQKQQPQAVKELAKEVGKQEKKKKIKFKIVDEPMPPTEEQYATALGGGASALETGDY